ncbi:hypothetical protein [Sphingomonas aurantiaca]|uniref:hypothetical protein n=1 Tax=Sphingomonas aurantiaca TaxID=185949 RepID=UPI003A5C1744
MAAPAAAETGDLSAYLKARAADAAGRPDLAAASYAKVLAAAPDDPVVAIRAYREALEAGDMPLAARAAAVLNRAGVAPADAALLPLADAARAGMPRLPTPRSRRFPPGRLWFSHRRSTPGSRMPRVAIPNRRSPPPPRTPSPTASPPRRVR